MIKILSVSITSVILLLNVNSAYADISRGKALHDANCTRCHISMMGGDGSGIYTREDHRVTDLEMLNQQVHRCHDSQGFTWPEDQVNDVVQYLNTTYYHFGNGKAAK